MVTQTAYLAPEVRIRPIDPRSGAAGDPFTGSMTSLSVELVNTGVSKLDLVLNNQAYGNDQLPMQPPYRYNDFRSFDYGRQLQVDLRYVGGTAVSRDDLRLGQVPDASGGGWTPVIRARIVDLKFSFPNSGGATLRVKGEDLLSVLKTEPSQDKTWREKQELEIVRELVTDPAHGLTLADAPSGSRHSFSRPLRRVQQRKGRTHLQFIREMADRLDYELFAAFDTPTDPDSAVRIHFEAARSGTLDERSLVDLAWGLNMLDFEPQFQFWHQYTGAKAVGRDPWGSGRFDAESEPDAVEHDFQVEGRRSDALSAVEVRRSFNKRENLAAENIKNIEVTNIDRERAVVRANAVLLTQARTFLTARISTVGLPQLRPGIHVNIRGMHPPFDGLYYLTRVRHTLDASGFKSALETRRPGFGNPALYPSATPGEAG